MERFLREAKILSSLHHPNIVEFREMGAAGNLLYFVMEYVRGIDAAQMLDMHGPLAIDRAVGMACQMLAALEYAHGRGFVHRDIKPANILLAPSADGDVVKVTDFGLARVYQASYLSGLTLAGDIGGTIAFIAPEQITQFREAHPPADQYSVAATLYNLLTGKYIFDFPDKYQQQLLKILHEAPVPIHVRRPEVPRNYR